MGLKPFWILMAICKDIPVQKFITGVVDTGDQNINTDGTRKKTTGYLVGDVFAKTSMEQLNYTIMVSRISVLALDDFLTTPLEDFRPLNSRICRLRQYLRLIFSYFI